MSECKECDGTGIAPAISSLPPSPLGQPSDGLIYEAVSRRADPVAWDAALQESAALLLGQPEGCELPPLPEPWQRFPSAPEGSQDHFAADQMLAFRAEGIAATLAARQAPAGVAKPEPMMNIQGGPPLPVWYCRVVYEGWKARAGIDSTFDQFITKYPSFLSWESIGGLYRITPSSNGTVTKNVIDAAIAKEKGPAQ